MLFSIIIPVYNVQRYLDACIRSVIEQSFKDFEVILVDDGSTDRSGINCDAWANKDTRIRVIHQGNRGLAFARNVGIKESQAEYLIFLDSDDYWSDMDGLTKLKQVIESSQSVPEVILFAFQKKNLRTRKILKIPLTVQLQDSVTADECKKELLSKRQYCNSACVKAVQKDFLENNRIEFPIGRKSEDLIYSRCILTAMQKFAILSDPLLVYQINRESSITSSFTLKNYTDIIEQMTQDLTQICQEPFSVQEQGKAYWAEQACWFLGYLPWVDRPLQRLIDECEIAFSILPYGLSRRTRLVSRMVNTIGKPATVRLLNLYLHSHTR